MISRRWQRVAASRVAGAVAVAVLVTLSTAVAGSAQSSPAQSATCAGLAIPGWTAQEQWVWSQVCNQQSADLDQAGTFGPKPTPDDQASWSPQRRLRAGFLRSLILDEPFTSRLANRSIRIVGAWFDEPVDLAQAAIPQTLLLEKSRFDRALDLGGIRIPTLSFEGSVLAEELNLNSAAVSGPLILRHARVPGVNLISATVGGNVELDHLASDGRVAMGGTRVGGSVFLRDAKLRNFGLVAGQVTGSVESDGATIGVEHGGVVAADELLLKGIDLDGVRVGGAVLLRSTIFGEARLVGADVSGRVDFSRSTFNGPLHLEGGRYARSVFLVDGTFQQVLLAGAAIEGTLSVTGATVSELNLRNATVGKDLRLARDGKDPPLWAGNGVLDLRSTSVGAIDDADKAWPRTVRLAGFTYQQPRGSTTPAGQDLASRSLDWYRDWLGRGDGAGFAGQPHLALEEALRKAGRPLVADDIAMDRRGKEPPGWGLPWVVNFLYGWSIGYGYRPEWAVGWTILLLLAGSLVVRRKRESDFRASQKIWSPELFSIDHIVPLVKFSKVNADADWAVMSPFGRRAFYFLKASGYVLAAFLLAALAKVTV